jgi:anaerobic dimethyl sulfoxide reductase subunit A
MTAKDDGVRGVERLKSPVKLIFNLAGNMLINQHSDCGRSAEILRDTAKCEFIVVSDLFMTPSARFADILLPAPSFLEAPNITFPYDEGDYLLHNNPVVSPPGESRFEYDWLKELAREIGLYDEFTGGYESAGDWLRTAYENLRANSPDKLPPYGDFKEAGGYFYPQRTRTVAFREQIENGVPFPTPSGKIEIFSPRLYALQKTDIPALPCYAPGFENSADPGIKEHPFQLIGWHSKRRCHSIHDNNPGMDTIEAPFVEMNAADAAPPGIHDGDMCEVWNARGRIRIKARVTDNIMRGVLATSQGAWWTPDGDGVDIRGNINTLTTQRPTPLAKGNPQHSNLVSIRKL